MNKTLFGRWRIYTFRSHKDGPGFTGHLFLSGRDRDGHLDRTINDYQLYTCRHRRWVVEAIFSVADGALGGDELQFRYALPFIGRLSFSIARAPRLVRWLGVAYRQGKSLDDNMREIGINWDSDHLTLALWANGEKHWGGRFRYINLRDIFLGRVEVTETGLYQTEVPVVLPEGDYVARIELVRRRSKRRFGKESAGIIRAYIQVHEPGRPFLPKLNRWDIDRDAVYETDVVIKSDDVLEEAISEAMNLLLMEMEMRRERFGDWRRAAFRVSEAEPAKATIETG